MIYGLLTPNPSSVVKKFHHMRNLTSFGQNESIDEQPFTCLLD